MRQPAVTAGGSRTTGSAGRTTPDLHRRRVCLAGAAALAGCQAMPISDTGAAAATLPPHEAPPPVPREFRAAWVASVAQIDWPSRPGLGADQWRREAQAWLDLVADSGLNAVVLQVRPAGDALYASALEPWSEYLTGAQGQAPEGARVPADDPLHHWVHEAHRRGLALHAWLNPYRARHTSARTPLVAPHLAVTHPQAVHRYGDQLWMDPAEPAAAQRMLDVVDDLIARYAIDGIHIDDYFYPYPAVATDGSEVAFPDDAAWQRYRDGGGLQERADWRRQQVDALVRALWQRVAAARPGVRLGISPFGLGRPIWRPAGIQGFSQYDRLYADVELWLEQGWLDYLAPQLYWPRDRAAQAFEVLADYWHARNSRARSVWPGLYTSRLLDARDPWPTDEVLGQIDLLRQRADRPGGAGHLHFSVRALRDDPGGIARRLRAGPYAQPALVPDAPWRREAAPEAPRARRGVDGQLHLQADGTLSHWVLWQRQQGQWTLELRPTQPGRPGANTRPQVHATSVIVTGDAVVASVVRPQGPESERVALRWGPA